LVLAITDTYVKSETERLELFRTLFRENFLCVCACLRRVGVRPCDVEDIAHDVFLTVYQQLDTFDPAGSPRPWLAPFRLRSARTELASHRRALLFRRSLRRTRARELTAPVPAIESDQLDLERRLLDRVRHALAARDYLSAGATLGTYENTFDNGQLAEEEQALKIRWLAASGQHAAARDRAARFKERFPSSFFRPAVETAIRGMSQEGTDP